MGVARLVAWLSIVSAAAEALFEDQAFKFDWRQRYVGVPVKSFVLDTRILVATESNVIAALEANTGDILWRHILSYDDDSVDLADVTLSSSGTTMTTLLATNSGELIVQSWSLQTGFLTGEASMAAGNSKSRPRWTFLAGNEVNAIYGEEEDGRLEVRAFDVASGSLLRTLTLDDLDDVKCVKTDTVFVCVSNDGGAIRYVSLPVTESSFKSVKVDVGGRVTAVPHLDAVSVGNVLVSFENGNFAGSRVFPDFSVLSSRCGSVLSVSQTEDGLRVADDDAEEVVSINLNEDRGKVVSVVASGCDDQRLLIQHEDGSLSFVSPSGDVVWTREEGLASLESVELVDAVFHQHDEEDALEQQVRRDVFNQFWRRLRSHSSQLHCFVKHFLSNGVGSFVGGDQDDEFGIRKMIVAASTHGKVFGIDSKTGNVAWQFMVPGGLLSSPPPRLFVQRTAHHFGTDPICAMIYKSRNSINVLTFNPLNGRNRETKQPKDIGTSYAKAFLLHHANEDHIRPLVILSTDGRLAVEPEAAEPHVGQFSGKLFVATADGEKVVGRRVSVTRQGTLKVSTVWTLSSPGAKILRVVGKSTDEVVHSQGRVMADRSVLFKYVNPNLAFVLAEGKDASSKTFVNVYLVDLVTGKVVFSATHKRVGGPYHVVHSENWAVYVYRNDKSRRAEFSSLEMFEGKSQTNATTFSSFADAGRLMPLVERQSFVLGHSNSHVTALTDTKTEKAITAKHVLMATVAGAIYDVPRHYLDPRRPNVNTPPDQREPGLPPYVPELSVSPEFVLNYNRTVAKIRGIVTAPTGLESTSVVFAHGLDLYSSSVTPSKGFDLLKDDFDHYVISIVLLALIVASYVTRRLWLRKNLNQAWR